MIYHKITNMVQYTHGTGKNKNSRVRRDGDVQKAVKQTGTDRKEVQSMAPGEDRGRVGEVRLSDEQIFYKGATFGLAIAILLLLILIFFMKFFNL